MEPILDHENQKANTSPFFLSSYTMQIAKIISMFFHPNLLSICTGNLGIFDILQFEISSLTFFS